MLVELQLVQLKWQLWDNIGIEISISLNDSKDIFSESLSRAIVEVKPSKL
jgi:hypothetical protein